MSAEAATLQLPPPQNNMSGLKPILVLVGLAAAVALGVVVVLWSQEPSYTLLLGKVSNEDIAQVASTLESAGIPFKTDTGSGSISVPANRVNEARLKLASEGLPNSGGFAAITKDNGFGTSQLMENARYQYAQEIELAKTIANLQSVEGARVHLAIPEQSAFIRDRKTPSASVFVQLKNGRRLESGQVTAIVNLVASSVPGLDAEHVTVVDQKGHLLSSPNGNDEFAMRDKQYEFAHNMEELYTQRVQEMLTPLVGAGNVRAQVSAEVELAMTEETSEQFNPQGQVVRSEQTAEENNRNAGGVQGVPGALTNQPPAGGVAAAPNAATNNTATQTATEESQTTSASKQSTRNYEIDRKLAYTKQLPGRIKRLSVAVLVDNLRVTDEEGKTTETPFTPEQLDSMTKLVRDAVGFDEKRGDTVNVVNSSFRVAPVTPENELQTVPLWERPMIRDIAKLVLGLIALLVLIFAVVRPLMRSVMATLSNMSAPPQLAAPQQQAQSIGPGSPAAMGYEQQLSNARTVVQQDPRRVAQVVKTWVSDNE
ncbi:MAG TPA: flagellar basal-body MS-ring/collar protein FliF [Steroidobacteraceae bacterium]|jgi:flagellar M-ring protein FliF|nr:flagellar basal-body MS-ring/collar protein FliF [Steroidobacteraceae bacterium]